MGGAIGSGKIERLIEFTESRRRVILNEAAHVSGKDGKLVWCVACVGGKILIAAQRVEKAPPVRDRERQRKPTEYRAERA